MFFAERHTAQKHEYAEKNDNDTHHDNSDGIFDLVIRVQISHAYNAQNLDNNQN